MKNSTEFIVKRKELICSTLKKLLIDIAKLERELEVSHDIENVDEIKISLCCDNRISSFDTDFYIRLEINRGETVGKYKNINFRHLAGLEKYSRVDIKDFIILIHDLLNFKDLPEDFAVRHLQNLEKLPEILNES